MIGLLLPRPVHIQYITALLSVVDLNISALLGLDVHDGNNLFVNSVTSDIQYRVMISKYSFQYENRWITRLTRRSEHLYVQLDGGIQ